MLNKLELYFFRGNRFFNLGDELSPFIINKLTGRQIIRVEDTYKTALFGIGSILGNIRHENQIVWGAGFISEGGSLKVKPRVTAVRGPLSSLRLSCIKNIPVGDPALLLPDIYTPPETQALYDVGIIPHYIDQKVIINSLKIDDISSYTILNIATNNVCGFIDAITKCKFIVSSTLHGLIIAHAYGIPARWVEFSDNVIGNGYKFFDYFLSVGIPPYRAEKLLGEALTLRNLMRITQQKNSHH